MKESLFKCFRSFGFAWNGMVYVFRNENNMRYHALAAIVILLIGVYLKFSRVEWLAIIFSIGIVWTAEIVNTAIEKLVDIVSPEYNLKAGLIKDIASGAVLVASGMAFIVGIVVVGSKFV